MKYIARVPATKLGYVFIETLKEHLNTEGYKIVTRFTGKRVTGFGGHTRKEDAESIRIYLKPRGEYTDMAEQIDEQERRLDTQARTIRQLIKTDSQVLRIKEILNDNDK